MKQKSDLPLLSYKKALIFPFFVLIFSPIMQTEEKRRLDAFAFLWPRLK